MVQDIRIAVIGMGPRGLGAIEALFATLTDGISVTLDLFDPRPCPGAGPNFSPSQNSLNLLNLPLRAVDLPSPPRNFPSLAEWLGQDKKAMETYPSRAQLGSYLTGRFANLVEAGQAGVTISQHQLAADQLLRDAADGWWIRAAGARHGPYDEVLLAQGQPATAPDQQLAKWHEHARCGVRDVVSVYPDHELLDAASGWAGKVVAVRGMGLATLDAIRLLTLGQGGKFRDGEYLPSGREPLRILPFSLNGLPPYPKPETLAIDARFAPSREETGSFCAALRRAIDLPGEGAIEALCEAIVPPVIRVLESQSVDLSEHEIRSWLACEQNAPGEQEVRGPVDVLRAGIAMAAGETPPDIGYTIGQIWRKWQNELREVYNPSAPRPGTISALIAFDEGLKRYSYGPPLSTMTELLTLVEAGRVDLRAANDPDILMTRDGWQLVEEDETARVVAIVDAVLPTPQLGQMTDPLIAALRDSGDLTAIGPKLGVKLRPDGGVIGRAGPLPGLSLLGRLGLGSVIAVDSLHDCFGAAADRWAAGVVSRALR
ncbi:FAD/NAD(P)-binding protein [Paracoccus sp. MBLB3053]|uniref:FAD/NAD(P)-binding protein n=1 Tax=Paracoccus aurantius TaxID=3073814 RepID=A0ABU2HWJ1_9RHOB|nr:FAD/NAD(P)-binding protein [Paracoccus sp. MBLB3053]MDS9469097.1 FAD/NAD(P)-binding protein [Paracoccus sp. MBLB3053]